MSVSDMYTCEVVNLFIVKYFDLFVVAFQT